MSDSRIAKSHSLLAFSRSYHRESFAYLRQRIETENLTTNNVKLWVQSHEKLQQAHQSNDILHLLRDTTCAIGTGTCRNWNESIHFFPTAMKFAVIDCDRIIALVNRRNLSLEMIQLRTSTQSITILNFILEFLGGPAIDQGVSNVLGDRVHNP